MPTLANAHGWAVMTNARCWAVMAKAHCWAMAVLLGLSACAAPRPKHLIGPPDLTIDQVRAEIQRLQRVELVGQLSGADRGGSIAAVSLIGAGLALLADAAESGYDHARVHYAWLQATAEESHPDLARAGALLAKVPRDYIDQRSYLEVKVALALANNDWKAAKKALKSLRKVNRKWGASDQREVALQRALAEQKAYREAI